MQKTNEKYSHDRKEVIVRKESLNPDVKIHVYSGMLLIPSKFTIFFYFKVIDDKWVKNLQMTTCPNVKCLGFWDLDRKERG